MMQTVEKFIRYGWAIPLTPTELVAPGIVTELTQQVLKGKRKRYIWIAAGASIQTADADEWFIFGRLSFFRKGTSVGTFEFCDCSAETFAATRAEAPRQLSRIKPNGTGSTQPVLQFNDYLPASGYVRDNLDCPCFEFEIDCDEVRYEVEKAYFNGNPANYFAIVIGAKIVSV